MYMLRKIFDNSTIEYIIDNSTIEYIIDNGLTKLDSIDVRRTPFLRTYII